MTNQVSWVKDELVENENNDEIINDDTKTKVVNEVIDRVESYVYLGDKLKLGLDNQTAGIKRRIGLSWAAFGKLRTVFKCNMNNSLKR